jgi:hypothetical protein
LVRAHASQAENFISAYGRVMTRILVSLSERFGDRIDICSEQSLVEGQALLIYDHLFQVQAQVLGIERALDDDRQWYQLQLISGLEPHDG